MDEWGSYVIAFVALVVFGALLRTPVLNWICGPLLVILIVVGIGKLKDRHRAGRQ